MTSSRGSEIAYVEAWACTFALREALRLGDLHIDRRDYVVVRLTTSDGTEGIAYGLSRGAPVDLAVTDLLAPLVLGENALDIPRLIERCARASVALGTEGILQRAISLLDISLWDIKAKVVGLPLWRLLGGYRTAAPVLLVEGYPKANESDSAFAERLGERVKQGFSALKMANVADPVAMHDRLQATRAAVGPSVALVVDVVWAWRDIRSAIEIARSWEPYRLAWIEDPFPPQRVAALARLRAAVDTPIAAGDEVSSIRTFEELISEQAVDVLRLDATTIGGISGFATCHAKAVDAGCVVSPHVYPEIHQHCAFAWPGVDPVEMFPSDSEFWCTDRFIRSGCVTLGTGGALEAPEAAGLGLEIDWDSVRTHAVRHSTVGDSPVVRG